jgi:mono/diheme cytochrome c family protein
MSLTLGRRLQFAIPALLTLALTACGHSDDQHAEAGAEITPELVAEGAAAYIAVGTCAACHGADAQGGPLGPDLTDGNWIWVDPSSPTLLSDVMTVIREGVPQPRDAAMPMLPMGGATISDAQLRAISAYLIDQN